jgi:hypothetical protein
VSVVLLLLAVVLGGLSVATLIVGSVWVGLGGLLLAAFGMAVSILLDEHSWSGRS